MLLPFVNVRIGVPGMSLTLYQHLAFMLTYQSMGFARLAEDVIRKVRGKGETEKLGAMDKILASSVGGALATWNQPIEVVRVEVRNITALWVLY